MDRTASVAELDPPELEESDLYSHDPAQVREPPRGLWSTVRWLGPGLILVGSVVGSGEIILTTTLGATVGFGMLWWILLSCWGKSFVQAELARYAVSSGRPAIVAFSRLPGQLPALGKSASWFVWLWILQQIPILLGQGGIYGGAGQALERMLPVLDARWWTVLVAVATSLLILSGTYRFLEKLLTVMVVSFTFITMICAVLLQVTEYRVTWADLRSGLSFEFPAVAVGAALAAYGGTGVAASESMAYTYWCSEKGYARFSGAPDGSEGWIRRARGWIRVMQTDVVLTLIVLTLATIPFYLLGAAVLHRKSQVPGGIGTIDALSSMYTETLGPWAFWLFMLGAFFVLFSTCVSVLGGNSRIMADCAGAIGLLDPASYGQRRRFQRIWAVFAPAVQALSYFYFENPVWMLTISGTTAAFLMPIVAGSTIFVRHRHLDPRLAPSRTMDFFLWLTFLIMLGIGAYTVWVKSAGA